MLTDLPNTFEEKLVKVFIRDKLKWLEGGWRVTEEGKGRRERKMREGGRR